MPPYLELCSPYGQRHCDDILYDIFNEHLLPLDNRKVPLMEALGISLMAGLPIEHAYGKKGALVTAGLVLSGPGGTFDRAAACIHAHMRSVHGLSVTGE